MQYQGHEIPVKASWNPGFGLHPLLLEALYCRLPCIPIVNGKVLRVAGASPNGQGGTKVNHLSQCTTWSINLLIHSDWSWSEQTLFSSTGHSGFLRFDCRGRWLWDQTFRRPTSGYPNRWGQDSWGRNFELGGSFEVARERKVIHETFLGATRKILLLESPKSPLNFRPNLT